MGISVLGPLAVDGVSVTLTRRDRIVLAALAMTPGEVLSSDRLADALWPGRPPTTWNKVVQGCVVRLRKLPEREQSRPCRRDTACQFRLTTWTCTGSNAFSAGLVSGWLWASPTELVSSPTRRWPSGRASRCSTSSTGTPDGWRATG